MTVDLHEQGERLSDRWTGFGPAIHSGLCIGLLQSIL